MTIIYRTENTSIRKEKANQYLLRVNDWEKYKIFWVNFPFTHVKVIKDKKGGTAKEFLEFTIHADSIQTLAQAVKGARNFLTYETAMLLLADIGNQLRALERFGLAVPSISEHDIVVVNDKRFLYMGDYMTLKVTDGSIPIEKPYTKGEFSSPELLMTTQIPARISSKAQLYSLGALTAWALTGVVPKADGKDYERVLDRLYATKLFWALQRCLVVDPADRYCLII